jgi:hypothetical protein
VEGELGVLAGIEDEVSSAVTHYTKPQEVEDFVKKTGDDGKGSRHSLSGHEREMESHCRDGKEPFK